MQEIRGIIEWLTQLKCRTDLNCQYIVPYVTERRCSVHLLDRHRTEKTVVQLNYLLHDFYRLVTGT